MTEEIMICPKCKLEYRKGFVVCAHCQIPLIKKPKDRIISHKKLTKDEHIGKSFLIVPTTVAVLLVLFILFAILFSRSCSKMF